MNQNHTVLHFSKSDKVILWLGFPLAGLVLGWFLPAIAKWGSSLPWLPFQGPLKLIASYNGAWVGIITMALGLIAGLLLTLLSFHESLETKVYDDQVIFKLRDDEEIFKKDDTSLVCMDKKHLILLGRSTAPTCPLPPMRC